MNFEHHVTNLAVDAKINRSDLDYIIGNLQQPPPPPAPPPPPTDAAADRERLRVKRKKANADGEMRIFCSRNIWNVVFTLALLRCQEN